LFFTHPEQIAEYAEKILGKPAKEVKKKAKPRRPATPARPVESTKRKGRAKA
jgi:hypothetical protein